MHNIFQGVITALITPFNNQAIDFISLEKILIHQISSGIKAIVIGGSTGEGSSLSADEYFAVLDFTRNFLDQHSQVVSIIAGCNKSCTKEALDFVAKLQKRKVDGLMICIPPYVKPTQEGIVAHFRAIHDATSMPIMLYSVPSRTGVDFTDQSILTLCDLERVVAIKDAGGDPVRALRLVAQLGQKVNILSGDDCTALAFNAHGARGVVSVISNLIPEKSVLLQRLWNENQFQQALELQLQLMPFCQALFAETNPIGIKYAMSLANLCTSEVRMPLCSLSEQNKTLLAARWQKILSSK